MIYEQFKKQFHISLNPQQEQAVQATEGPVLLLAVPGSGKTTVLVTRLGYMVLSKNIDPAQILTMTYTVAATADIRRRCSALFGEDLASQLEFRTINGISVRVIQYYERLLGRKAFSLITEEGQISNILGEVYRRIAHDFPTESVIKTLRTHITYAKNMMLTDQEIDALKPDGMDFGSMYREYCKILKEEGWMDYDDQMVYAYRMLRSYPEILNHFQNQYQYFCVDEAQDTSKIQHEIIRLLASRSKNLFMVGDEDQSIYGFRAAYPEALMEFSKLYPNAKTLLMEQNYRSTPEIVTTANKFIQRNKNRHPKNMITTNAPGTEITAIPVFDRRGQYDWILREVQRMGSEAVAEEGAVSKPVELAVLYRDNDSALPLIDSLNRLGIGYRCRQIDSTFFSHRVVRDLTDIMKFALDPSDGELFMNIYYKLGAGISKALAEQAVHIASKLGESIWDVLIDSHAPSAWTKKQCRSLRTHCENMVDEPANKAVYRIVHFMGYGDYMDDRGMDDNKAHILEVLGMSEPNSRRLLERLNELADIVKLGSTDKTAPLVLSTIHSSKGLEYDRVILLDVVDGVFPKVEPIQTPESLSAMEEERRLFYVAMTRARRELSLFQFKRDDLTSSFFDAIFPKSSINDRRRIGVSNGFKTHRHLSAANPIDRETLAEESALYLPSVRIRHKKFGDGVITSRYRDMITIKLDSGEEKKFSLQIVLENDQISRI
ncbi:MAG: ATP-dependent helicase [Firmicutes bacterium]|nr:ATP-dependent helicase [Bacillota bacterium]